MLRTMQLLVQGLVEDFARKICTAESPFPMKTTFLHYVLRCISETLARRICKAESPFRRKATFLRCVLHCISEMPSRTLGNSKIAMLPQSDLSDTKGTTPCVDKVEEG
jgi:hypothetical protein